MDESVQFVSISESYPPSKDITLQYKRKRGTTQPHNSRDWIGLFRVGWTSNKDYHSYVWAAAPPSNPDHEEGTSEVVFPVSHLPAECEHFYQFCYITRDNVLLGASPPFRFITARACELIEEVGGEMESLIVVRLKDGDKSDSRQTEDTTSAISAPPSREGDANPEGKIPVFETSLCDISSVMLQQTLPATSEHVAGTHSQTCKVEDFATEVGQHTAAQKPDSRTSDDVPKVRQSPVVVLDRRCCELEAELEKERAKATELTSKLEESRRTIAQCQQERDEERALFHSQLEEQRAKIRAFSARQEASDNKMEELAEEAAKAKSETQALKVTVHALRSQLEEAEKKLLGKQKELEEVKMELVYNQENISELIGALKESDSGDHSSSRRQGADSNERPTRGDTAQACPVCNKVFPVSQAFEQHVQSHFQD